MRELGKLKYQKRKMFHIKTNLFMKTFDFKDIMNIEKCVIMYFGILRRGKMGNSILYLNEKKADTLIAPFIYIYGVRVLDQQLEVLAFSDSKQVEFSVNGQLRSRQKNENGEFDFVFDMPVGETVIRTNATGLPDKFDEICIAL